MAIHLLNLPVKQFLPVWLRQILRAYGMTVGKVRDGGLAMTRKAADTFFWGSLDSRK